MRILLIVNPQRRDMYEYLQNDLVAQYFLLWSESRGSIPFHERKDSYPLTFTEEYYWNEFSTPVSLLRTINPDKIVFMEIIDLRQIALIVAAGAKNISTFYLEHGAAGSAATAISRWSEVTLKNGKLQYYIRRFKTSLWKVIQAKFFYYSQFSGFKTFNSRLKYWALPFKMLRGAPNNKVLANNLFRERVPQHCIVFSRINLEEFSVYTGITEAEALLTGIPSFDKYFLQKPVEEDYLVYIDSPYFEERIVNWTDTHHRIIAEKLFSFAAKKKLKIYIKLHPRSNKKLWESYKNKPQLVVILQYEECTSLYLKSKLILGFSSSLTTAFLCANKNFVLLGWNPVPEIFGMNFAETGLCHKSLKISDLDNKFEFWCNNNLTCQRAKYDDFIHQCNEPFDGQATKRVIDAIHTL